MGRHCRMQLVTFLLYVLLNVGSGQTLQLDERLTPEDLCQTLTRNPTLRNALEESKGKAVACPCTQSIVETDLSFEHKNSCYTQYFFTDGVKQMCCYDYYGNLVKTGEHGGYIIDERFEHDIAAARRACCVETNNCEAFYSLNPPDDCSRYRQPYSVRSWGDPHITTLDNHNYTFNGHGEYLFVQLNNSEGEVQIQTRTEYQTEGVVDATIFVAFVVHVQNGNDSDLISVFLNKTSGLSVYNSSGAPIPIGEPRQSKLRRIYHMRSDVISINVDVLPLTITISSSVGLGLDITLTPKESLKGIGLAGSVVEGSFVGRNGTKYNINSTEAGLFLYGESWSLKANESKFNYSLTGGSFEQYNANHTTPRFLEQLTGNLTALFQEWNEDNITLFNETCFMDWKNEVSTDCLLAIARSGNVELGIATINKLRKQYNIMRQNNNKPPKFTADMITHLKVNYSDTEPLIIDLSKYVTDPNNDTLTFEVSTNIINTTTYSIDPNTGLFSWLVDDQGRSDDLKLTFIVRDEYNVTVPKVVSISYCGCEKSNYCAFDFTDPKDASTFERSECSCTGRYSSGRFCESRINPCEITNCTYAGFNITCDENSEDDNPCGDCPDGYQESFSLRQQICEDIDECNDQGWCEQSCENLVGSFECDCYKGFSLNSTNKRTCIDIDECAEGSKTCSDNELCSDPRGNATCVCKAGYSRKEGGPCEKIKGFSYTFTMSLQLSGDIKPETLETEDFKNQTKQELLRTLNSTIDLIDIIIRRIYFEAQQKTQRKKRASQSRKMHIDYVVVTRKQTTYKDLGGNMTAALSTSNITLNNASVSIPENFTVKRPPEGSCTLGNSCDGQTAKCVDKNGNITCECMAGFKRTNTSSSYCIDIDECMQNDTPSRCYGGTCINLYGGWNCSCPVNTSWAKVGEVSYPYHYRCQGNHSYIGNMSLYRAEQHEIKTDNETTTYIQDLFNLWIKNETVEEGDTPLTDLYLSTTIFNFKATSKHFLGTQYGYLYNFSFILSLGESVNISRINSVFQAGNSTGIRPNNACKNVTNDCRIFKMIFYNDTDEILCHLGNDCDPLSTKCAVSGGKYHCQCKTGFEAYDDLLCRDLDECYADDFSCPGNSTCINHIGNWTCACPDGYTTTYEDYHSITCTDVDECSDNTTYGCLQGKCNNTDGGWECVCAPGFISNKLTENVYTCKDVDECLGSEYNCHNNGTCINLQNGTWTCTCPAGYKAETINDKNINCTDIDECADNTTYFCQNGTCSNTEGSWDCGCDTGFRSQWNKKHNYSCIDIDECEEGKCNGNCTNTHGSFNCDCQDGFKRSNGTNGSIVCTDIDECSLTDTYNCSGGPCVNDIGGWGCQCDKGYTPRKLSNTTIECHDVNECDDIICLESSCINTNGRFHCSCSDGYEMDNVTDNVYQCKDIKECSQKDSEYHCLNGGQCQELQGNWTCNCPVGYATEFLNRTHIDCKDIDECSLDSGYSCKHGQCSNHPGNWTCECNPGFKFKSKTNTSVICEDIDECANNTCDGECVNLSGSWSCSCPAGFNNSTISASHIVCQDINECENGSGFHCKNAMGCINTNGSWTCNCRDGERLQTVNQSTKICEAGKTYSFQREVTIVTTNPLLQSNRTVLENVLRKKIKSIFLRVFPDGEFSVGVDALKEVSDKLNTYAAFFWVRAYSVKPREVIVADWNSSYKQECDRAICIENQETTVFQITFTEETDTQGFSSNLCSIEGANTCNPASTDCSMKDGEIECLCKDGFEKNPESSTSCKDVDECDISGQCTRGSCLNTVGAFTCKCPAGLDNPVKNSTNITVCSGSNKYTQVTELSVSRELNQSEKADLVKKLEEKIRQTYEEDLKGVTVTVVVTISYIEPTTPTRRKRADQVKTSFGYTLKSTIYANVSDQENELEDVLKRVVTKKKIDDITEANITSVSDPKWNKATTTTASTTKDVTTISPCTCEDGCKCVSGSGEQQCICPTTTTQSVKVEPKSDSELQDLKTLLFGTAGGLGFLILILVVVIVLVCRRYSKQQKRKSRKGEHIQLGPMGAGSTGEVYIGQEFTSTDVDKLSMGTTYSNRFRPGQLPSIQGLPEPRPDYDPPPIYAKPDIHRSVPMNPLYGRSGSPTPDYRDGRLPRTSDSSHDSGMEVSRGSLNFDRRRREPNNRRVHSLYNQSNQM